MIIYEHIWWYMTYMIIYDHVWSYIWSYMGIYINTLPYVTIYGHTWWYMIWTYTIVYDHSWSSMRWSYMIIYNHVRSCMIIYNYVWWWPLIYGHRHVTNCQFADHEQNMKGQQVTCCECLANTRLLDNQQLRGCQLDSCI